MQSIVGLESPLISVRLMRSADKTGFVEMLSFTSALASYLRSRAAAAMHCLETLHPTYLSSLLILHLLLYEVICKRCNMQFLSSVTKLHAYFSAL